MRFIMKTEKKELTKIALRIDNLLNIETLTKQKEIPSGNITEKFKNKRKLNS